MYEELEEQQEEHLETNQGENSEDEEEATGSKSEEAKAAEAIAQAALRESGESGKLTTDADELLGSAMTTSEFPKPRPVKAPEVPQMDRKNWLLHHHFLRKEIPTCKSLIEEQLEETSDSCEYALFMKAVIWRQEGRIQESLDLFQACAMMDPQNLDYIKQIARSLFLLGKQKNALDVLNEALKISDSDWEIHYWKALCYFHSREYSNAKTALQDALKISKQEQTFVLIGKICSEENDLMSAIEAYRRALELSPENPDILTKLGLLYMKTDSFQQAFEALGRALSFNPSHSGAILAAGSMMQQHGDFDVALTKYRIAAQEMPDNAQLWSNIGMCFFGKKKYVAAISCLKRANYLAPFDWKILYNLGVVHLAMSQYASAFHFVSAAINIQPKVAALFMTLAVALTNLEDMQNAKQAYEHASELDKKDPTLALNYAIFLLKQGEKGKAAAWFSTFESRLHSVRDPKTGHLRIDNEVLEMAEIFRSTMISDDHTGSKSSADGAGQRLPKETPAHLRKDEFNADPVSLPPRTAGSAGGDGRDRDRTGLDTAASRETALTLSSEPKLVEGSPEESSAS